MANKLKVGVIGVGGLGQWHARIFSELSSTDLVGVYDIDGKRASEIAAKYGTKAFESMEELASCIEAASIVVPAHAHYAAASALLSRGVHTLVEKPIATTPEDAEAMIRLAESKHLVLQVGHVERFNPVMKSLEEILTNPRFIEATRLAPYPAARPDLPARGTDVSVVLDLMIHDLEIILHLVRSPLKELHATGVSVLSAGEDIANVRLCFENKCVANVTASRISQKQMRKIRIFQENAYVSLDYQNQSGEIYRKTEKGISAAAVPVEKGQPLDIELASFADCVISRRQPEVSGKQASEALRLAVAICDHIRRGGS